MYNSLLTWNLEVLCFEDGGKPYNARGKDESQQQTQPTYGSNYGIRTLATSVGVEFSTTAASPLRESQGNQYFLKVFSWLVWRNRSQEFVQRTFRRNLKFL